VEPRIITRDEFLQRYWNYYLLLEKDFLYTERYVAIDELNFNSYSNEYIKQYQTICSEIDVIAKSFCKELDSHFRGSTIDVYCKVIVDNNSDFSCRIIKVKNKNIEITPWRNWNYTVEVQRDGTIRPVADNPNWWKKYNKIKHNRTTINNETGLPYYKLANQENTLNALAALFQLEMYYHRLLQRNHFPNDIDIPEPVSTLFDVKDWNNRWSVCTSIRLGSF
jgi:hypothetical protein